MNAAKKGSVRDISFYRLFVRGGILSLVIIYIALWGRMIANPSERTGADFIAFFAAGRIALTGELEDVYLPEAQQSQEEVILGFSIATEDVALYNHMPFILPLLSVIALAPYLAAFHLWAIIMLSLYWGSTWLMARTLHDFANYCEFTFAIPLFFPAFVSILNGQDSAILFIGAALWLHGFIRGDDRLAGVGLALTTIRPHIALLIAVPFLFNRRKIWWWFVASASVLILISVLLVGVRGVENFLHILVISASGEGYTVNEPAMVNFIGFMRRLAPGIPSFYTRLIGWIIYASALVLLCMIWIRSKKVDERHIGLAVLLAVFTVPHLHYHDLVLLLIPIICVMMLISRQGVLDSKYIASIPLVISWAMVVSNFLPVLKQTIPFAIGLALGIFLCHPAIFIKKNSTT